MASKYQFDRDMEAERLKMHDARLPAVNQLFMLRLAQEPPTDSLRLLRQFREDFEDYDLDTAVELWADFLQLPENKPATTPTCKRGRKPLNVSLQSICDKLREYQDITAAAHSLGISRAYIYRDIKAAGLSVKELTERGAKL